MILHLLPCNNSIFNLNLNLLCNSNCTYLITRRLSNCHKLDQKEFIKRLHNCHCAKQAAIDQRDRRVFNKQIYLGTVPSNQTNLLLEPNYTAWHYNPTAGEQKSKSHYFVKRVAVARSDNLTLSFCKCPGKQRLIKPKAVFVLNFLCHSSGCLDRRDWV